MSYFVKKPMTITQREILSRALAFEEEYPHDWGWRGVQASPGDLVALEIRGFLTITGRDSHGRRTYRLADKDRARKVVEEKLLPVHADEVK